MTTCSGRKQPSSTGSCGVVRHLMSRRQALIVMASPQLNGPATCGLDPVKSTVMVPSSSVIAISTRTGWSSVMPSLSKWATARYVPAGMRASEWHLASDMYDQSLPGGYSAHGDWFEGWQRDIAEAFVKNCDNTSSDCHSHLLGDGREIYSSIDGI